MTYFTVGASYSLLEGAICLISVFWSVDSVQVKLPQVQYPPRIFTFLMVNLEAVQNTGGLDMPSFKWVRALDYSSVH